MSDARLFTELCNRAAVEARQEVPLPGRKPTAKLTANPVRHGLIVVSLEGEIQFTSSEVRGWLKRFFPRPPRARALPRTIRCWMKLDLQARAHRSLAAKNNTARLFIRRSRPHPADCVVLLVEFVPENGADAKRRHGSLTRRENDVLEWIAAGKSNREMAEILTMSASTVGKHLERIFRKLGVENRTAAASFYRAESQAHS